MLLRYHKVTLYILLLALVSVGLISLSKKDDEFLVQQAVLESLRVKIPLDEYSFYSHPSTCRDVKPGRLPVATEYLFENFYQNNNLLERSVPRQLKIPGKQYHFISAEDSQRIYAGKLPELMGIPKQLINLSRAGFNVDKTQALLCVESQDSGDLLYLKKIKGVWQVSKWIYIW